MASEPNAQGRGRSGESHRKSVRAAANTANEAETANEAGALETITVDFKYKW